MIEQKKNEIPAPNAMIRTFHLVSDAYACCAPLRPLTGRVAYNVKRKNLSPVEMMMMMMNKIQEKKHCKATWCWCWTTPYLFIQLHLPALIPVGPRKHLDHPISPSTDYPSAILTPHHAADTFSPHQPVARDFLRARSFLE